MAHMPPVIETPLTKPTYHWLTHQHGPCADLEVEYFQCSNRVGGQRLKAECSEFMEDFLECVFRHKQNGRFLAMQAERKRQNRPYGPAPPKDILN